MNGTNPPNLDTLHSALNHTRSLLNAVNVLHTPITAALVNELEAYQTRLEKFIARLEPDTGETKNGKT